MFVEHPLIQKDRIQARDYQRALADACLHSSTLVVLPTGMGKTVVALLVIADVLEKRRGKVLLLAPTKPLVEQHALFLKQTLVGKKVCVLTGEIDPEEREVEWIQSDVVASTPQVIANDLRTERISLKDVRLIIFDEAHRGVGNYAYVSIAQEYRGVPGGLVMGMTASPGSSMAKIKEVCGNLDIDNIEVRSESDPDVSKYVHDIHMDCVEVDVPVSMRRLADKLRKMYDQCIKELIAMGVMTRGRPPSTKYLLEVQKAIQFKLNQGEKSHTLYNALSVQARAIKLGHALELAETQGVSSLTSYLEKLQEEALSPEGSKASRAIVASDEFKEIVELLGNLKMEHPKISRVMSIVSHQLIEKPDSRVIVFTQYRDTCDMVINYLSKIEGARVTKLIGQSGRGMDKGLKQKEQIGVLQRFREGEFNVLVATSVGEEGLDVANTDLVIFYEPVPSEIRSIQRRGRTGRSRAGRVVVLVTAGTRDEASLYSSEKKEREMRKRLYSLKDQWDRENKVKKEVAKVQKKGQTELGDYQAS
ncbi:helicase-related protein [Methanomassiliicoccus luminyensis]|uniref:helicase-related protein n=1 Tax=Methanomassiliicoccus luminyensis TaxID=1080712 RepID=UPI0003784AB1|nr:helicase-related protein [Methanomassiliicoccus luminyensis]